MSMPRLLVTGGAGFIGSHVCKLLSRNGFLPVVYDNLSTGHRDAVRWGPFVQGDILDTDRLAAVLAEYRPEAVLHFAGVAYPGESMENPAKYYSNNVVGSFSLLEALRRSDVRHLIFSSSCATYGTPQSLPVRESAPQKPISPYGHSKLMVEQMIADHAAAYGLRYVNLRYFNACGADPEGELGERHEPETHLIPCVLLSASGRLPYLTIFGDAYDTADGTCERDYVHVMDLAQAHVSAVRHLLDGGDNLSVNLGAERALSIHEIVKAVTRITGRQVPIQIKPNRPGDPPALFADTSLARQRLGFAPVHSDIDTIVRTAAPFFGLELRA